MKLPRALAAFNRSVNNPLQDLYAWLVPPWVVIVHRGRRSGRPHRTPVLGFRHGQTLVIALLYGEESDWLRNLRAGGGQVVRAGRTFELIGEPRVLPTPSTSELDGLSFLARAYCRLADRQVLLTIGPGRPGFGSGPGVSRRGGR